MNGRLLIQSHGALTRVRGFPLKHSSPFFQSPIHAYSVANATSKPSRRPWLKILFYASGFASSSFITYYLFSKNSSNRVLSSESFSPFTFQSKESITSTSSIFTLVPEKPSSASDPFQKLWHDGVWSVQVKQPQLQIARAYTPLPPSLAPSLQTPADGTLKFLIRHEVNGEVSGYLHRLPVGATVHLRGPKLEYMCPPDVDEIVFLAGGTGIAPALQVAHSLLESRKEGQVHPKMHILWACRKREDCAGGLSSTPPSATSWFQWFRPAKVAVTDQPSYIVEELNRMKMKHGQRLLVDYFVDEEGTSIKQETLKPLLTASSKANMVHGQKPRRLFLVAGPDGFVTYFAGRKEWSQGQEIQGHLGGLLKDLKLSEKEVWKL